MLTNAFEATPEGGEVKLWVEDAEEVVNFCVWNCRGIPEDVARRLFQRNFTTKEGSGRGLGTYAMRLLGETYLQGKVDFVTSATEGTLFRLCLPREATSDSQPMTRRATVFVVDDDPGSLQSICGLIRQANLPVRTFASGADFLRQYTAGEPGCLDS